MLTGASINAINAVGYNLADDKGYGRFAIATSSGNDQRICRFGTGSAVPPDPDGLLPLSPECLCTLTGHKGNSGVVAHDVLFFSSSGKNMLALSGLSSRPAGSAVDACSSAARRRLHSSTTPVLPEVASEAPPPALPQPKRHFGR